jgi:hypothetical protein
LLVLILDDRTLWKKDPDLYDNNMKVWEIGGRVYVALEASRVLGHGPEIYEGRD